MILSDVTELMLGDTPVDKLMLGNAAVWERDSGGGDPGTEYPVSPEDIVRKGFDDSGELADSTNRLACEAYFSPYADYGKSSDGQARSLTETPHSNAEWLALIFSECSALPENYIVAFACYTYSGVVQRYFLNFMSTASDSPDRVHIASSDASDNIFDFGSTAWSGRNHRYPSSRSFSGCDRETSSLPGYKGEGFSEGFRILYSTVPVYDIDGSLIGGMTSAAVRAELSKGGDVQYQVYWYRADKSFISASGWLSYPAYAKAPADAYYVRFALRKPDDSSIQPSELESVSLYLK